MAPKPIPRDARVSRKRSSVAVHLIETMNYLDTTVKEDGSTLDDKPSPTASHNTASSRNTAGSQPCTPGSSRFSPTQSSQARSSTVDLTQEEWDGGMSPALKAKLLSPITASKKVFRKFGRNSSGTLVNGSPSSSSFPNSPLSQSSSATISEESIDSEESSPAEPHPPMHTRPATPGPFRMSLAVSPPKPAPVTASSSVYSQDDAASVRSWQTESSTHTQRAIKSNDANDIDNIEVKDFGTVNKPKDDTPPSSVEPDNIFSFSPKRSTAGNSHHIRNKSALPPPLTIRKVSTPTTPSFSIPPLPAASSASTGTVGLGLIHPALRDGAYTPTRDTTGGAERDYLQVPPNSPVIHPGCPLTGGAWDSIVDRIVNDDATVDQNNSSTLTQRLLAVGPGETTITDCDRPLAGTTASQLERPDSQSTIRASERPQPQQVVVGSCDRPSPGIERPSCIPAFYSNSPGSDESNAASDPDTDIDSGAGVDSPPDGESETAARPARNAIQGLPGPHKPTIVVPAHKFTPQAAEIIVPVTISNQSKRAPSSMQRSQTAQPSSSPIRAPSSPSQSLIARRIREHSQAVRNHSLATYSSTETIRASTTNTSRSSSQETLRVVPPTTPQKLLYDATSGSLGVESRSTPGRLSSITATHPAFCGDLFETPTPTSSSFTDEQVALDRATLEARLRETSPTRIPSRVSLKKGEQVTPDLPAEAFRGLPSRFSDSSVEGGEEKRGFMQRVGFGGRVGGGGKMLVKGGGVALGGESGVGAGRVGGEGAGRAPVKGGLVAQMRKRYA
ncbi:hypothetical protein MBLNU457_3773t1 [Dothideomycetes sp. NU457]